MTRIVAIDTETTSLRPDRRIWEIGLIVTGPPTDIRWRDPAEVEDGHYRWFIDRDGLDLGNADPFALKIGGFYDRHPQMTPVEGVVKSEADVLRAVEMLTRGAHLLGAVPNFDADVLDRRMRAHGIAPSWHYHIIDIETLAIGFLRGRGDAVPELPWKSDDLSRLVGVEPPSDEDRHTALGDARWALRVWQAVMA